MTKPLKILHTADWHIGKQLYGYDLLEDHKRFFHWLVQTIKEEAVEVLMVAGDIFDKANPSKISEKCYIDLIKRIYRETDCQNIIITSGNHDGVATLQMHKSWADIIRVHTLSCVPENIADECIEIQDEQSNLLLVVCAVPFLRDKDIKKASAARSYTDNLTALSQGIIHHYESLDTLCKEKYDDTVPIIAMGHLYARGVTNNSNNIRDIHTIGNQVALQANCLPSRFQYVALGHIHRRQTFPGTPPVHYAGSPISLSFKERLYPHAVSLLVLSQGKLSSPQQLLIPCFRKLEVYEGTLEEIQQQIHDFKNKKELLPALAEIVIKQRCATPSLIISLNEYLQVQKNIQVVNTKIHVDKQEQQIDQMAGDFQYPQILNVKKVFQKKLAEEDVLPEQKKVLMEAFTEIFQQVKQSKAI